MAARLNVAIVIPVLNQLEYTKNCLKSLLPEIETGVRVVVIDNGSTDGTGAWLSKQPGIEVLANTENRGCAPAWNQGCRAVAGAEWIVVANNDLVFPCGWLPGLLDAAKRHELAVVSPAMRERDLNYSFQEHAAKIMSGMRDVVRRGVAHGVVFAVRADVFAKIGYFDEAFRIGQFEDSDFFRRAKLAGFPLGTVGAAFVHHFGSITQDALRSGPAVRPYEAENRAYYRAKWKIGWWRRRVEKISGQLRVRQWRISEQKRYGHTLHEKWEAGEWKAY